MIITKLREMDLLEPPVQEPVHAVQCDANTRAVAVTLTAGGVAWEPPGEVQISVAFKKPDGKKGWYDKLPDGSPACSVSENVVTAILAPEVLTAAGKVDVVIVFQDKDLNQLATFGFAILVEPNPAAGRGISNDYYNYSTMEAVNQALDSFFAQAEADYGAFTQKVETEQAAFLETATQALSEMHSTVTADAPGIVCEASGTVIAVADSSDRMLQGLRMYGRTTQITTTGKNLLQNTATTQTVNGVTFTVNEDGSITVNGTASAVAALRITPSAVDIPNGSYCYSSGSGSSGCYSYVIYDDNYYADDLTGQGVAFTVTKGRIVYCGIKVNAGVTVSNMVFRPQIELGSTATAYEPYTGGKPSPSPDYPQELVSAGESTNLIDPAAITTAANTNLYVWRDNGIILPAGTYTMWYVPGTTLNGMYVRTPTTPITTIAVGYNVNRLTFTLTEATLVYLDFYSTNLPDNTASSVMLERGSAPTRYRPYQKGGIGLTVAGKNLANISEPASGYYNDSHGTASNANSRFIRMRLSNVRPETEYTLSANLKIYSLWYFNGGTAISRQGVSDSNVKTFTTPKNCDNIRLSLHNTSGEADTGAFEWVQLELGAAATAYEPYKAQALIVSAPNGLPGIPVGSGGNYTDASGQQWICDEVDFARGMYVHWFKSFVLTGQEVFAEDTANPGRFSFDSGAVVYGGRCSHYPASMSHTDGTVYLNYTIKIMINDSRFAGNLTGFKAWLAQEYAAGNPVTVIARMHKDRGGGAETPLDADTLAAYSALHTNKPNTTVYNDAGAHMELSYVADTKLYIDNKIAAIAAAVLNNT